MSLRREAIRAARRAGCRCNPIISPTDVPLPPGATEAVMVRHLAGCPLGEQVKRWNDLGITPALHGGATQ